MCPHAEGEPGTQGSLVLPHGLGSRGSWSAGGLRQTQVPGWEAGREHARGPSGPALPAPASLPLALLTGLCELKRGSLAQPTWDPAAFQPPESPSLTSLITETGSVLL